MAQRMRPLPWIDRVFPRITYNRMIKLICGARTAQGDGLTPGGWDA